MTARVFCPGSKRITTAACTTAPVPAGSMLPVFGMLTGMIMPLTASTFVNLIFII